MGDVSGEKGSETSEGQVTLSALVTIPATYNDLKKLESSILLQMKTMLAELLPPKEAPIPSAPVSPAKASALNPLITFVPQKGIPIEEDKEGDTGTSSKGKDDSREKKDSCDSHAVPPPNNYSPSVPIPMPHIVSQGAPPPLDSNSFANWQFLMQSHVRSSSTELWRIIKEGFKPHDPENLARREVVDDQLNTTALHMIRLAVTPKDRAHIRT